MPQDNLPTGGPGQDNPPSAEPQQGGAPAAGASQDHDWEALATRYKEQMQGWQQEAARQQQQNMHFQQILAQQLQAARPQQAPATTQQVAAEMTDEEAEALSAAMAADDKAKIRQINNEVLKRVAEQASTRGAQMATEQFQRQQRQSQQFQQAFSVFQNPEMMQVLGNPNHPVTQQAMQIYRQRAADPSSGALYQQFPVGRDAFGNDQFFAPALLERAFLEAKSQFQASGQNYEPEQIASAGSHSGRRGGGRDEVPSSFAAEAERYLDADVASDPVKRAAEIKDLWAMTRPEDQAKYK